MRRLLAGADTSPGFEARVLARVAALEASPAAESRSLAERRRELEHRRLRRDSWMNAVTAAGIGAAGNCRRLAQWPGRRALGGRRRGPCHGSRAADGLRAGRAGARVVAGPAEPAAALESRDEESCRRRLHREVRGLRQAHPAARAQPHAQGLSPDRGDDQVGRSGVRARGHRRDDGGVQEARGVRLLERAAHPREARRRCRADVPEGREARHGRAPLPRAVGAAARTRSSSARSRRRWRSTRRESARSGC